MMRFTKRQTPFPSLAWERLCGPLPCPAPLPPAHPPGAQQRWLVVTEHSWPSSILGEKIWIPASLRTETG